MANQRLENLAQAISDMNPYGKDPDRALLVYDVLWSAICTETGRTSRYYGGDTPEARLYNQLSLAFHVFGRDATPAKGEE